MALLKDLIDAAIAAQDEIATDQKDLDTAIQTQAEVVRSAQARVDEASQGLIESKEAAKDDDAKLAKALKGRDVFRSGPDGEIILFYADSSSDRGWSKKTLTPETEEVPDEEPTPEPGPGEPEPVPFPAPGTDAGIVTPGDVVPGSGNPAQPEPGTEPGEPLPEQPPAHNYFGKPENAPAPRVDYHGKPIV